MMGEEQFVCDFSNMTDTFLTASMLMGRRGGTIMGVDNQRVKECDRITAVALNMNKCGFKVSEDGNTLRFSPSPLSSPSESHGGPCVITTFNDHRVAMAFAVLSCAPDESRVKKIFIENPRCVEKTYPGFWDMLETDLGLEVTGHDHVVGGTRLQYAFAIVGMRGIGKSTLGRVAAETLGYMFVDLDKCIEGKCSSSVEAIIETCGWEKFREIESQVLKTEVYVAEREQRLTIIATGGGVVESAESREILSMLKTVVWLKSQDDETTINAAIEASKSAPQYSETVEAVYRRRKPLYAAISAFDVYRGDFALSQMIRITSPTISHHNTPGVGSTFVCLTARDYTDWSARDFQQSIGYSSSVEAVEIRVDKILNLEIFLSDFARIRSLCKVPLILTLRSVAEGGDFAGTDYQATIEQLLRVCPDWIDVEVEKKVVLDYEVFHGTKFIASRHFAFERPENLRRAVESVAPDWADMGKIVLPDDFISLAFLARQISLERAKPIITLISGASGIPSRILNRRFTPCAAEDGEKHCPPAAAGQLKPHQLDLVRNNIFEQQPSFKFHLFGDPIDKSPSPFLHNLMFALKGLVGRNSCVYSPVPCSDLEIVRTCISSPFFRGASVTTPLKESVYAYLVSIGAELSEAAQSAQSVNTISVTSCGGLKGHNTDIIALENVLTESGCRRTSCLVIGTGGAGRGALHAAKMSSFDETFIFGRNSEKVKSICMETGSLPFNPSLAYDVVIGCIPPGVQSKVDLLPHIRAKSLVVDMAYIPRETVLIQTLGRHAEKVIYGSQILLLQAIAQHEIWLSSLLGRGEALRVDLTGVEINQDLLSGFLDKFRV
jgi:pentafunctional AROM polypeptide